MIIALLVSIPDGDAWVFKGRFSRLSCVVPAVSIPDGDAWVFKVSQYGACRRG